MTNGFNRQNAIIGAAIILAGGGGGIGGAMAGAEKAEKVERRVDQLETTQAVIKEKVTNIEENQTRIEGDNKDRHKEVLDAIKSLDK
jgi:hypothetical protein